MQSRVSLQSLVLCSLTTTLTASLLDPATSLLARLSSSAPDTEVVSYGPLGEVNTTRDWFHPRWRMFNPTPRTREAVGTTVALHTRRRPEGEHIWPRNDTNFPEMNCKLMTKVIVHGWRGESSRWITDMASELLKRDDVNVLVVRYQSDVNYFQASQDIRVAALELAALLTALERKCGLPAGNVHLIGHSLGAHLAGYVGTSISGIGRITGLDPAEPQFQYMPHYVRLDPSDAIFVDVIHTDSESIIGTDGLGMRQEAGHVDFYPNAGALQPGCSPLSIPGKVLRMAELEPACSHSRAPHLFLESINSECPFVGFECPSFQQLSTGECSTCGQKGERCGLMGLDALDFGLHTNRVNVRYFLKTASDPPYCLFPLTVLVHPFNSSVDTNFGGTFMVDLYGDKAAATAVPLTEGTREEGVRRLLGSSSVPVGRRVLRATLHWESSSQLLPCFLFCSTSPAFVSSITVSVFGAVPTFVSRSRLCAEDGAPFVKVEPYSVANFTTCKT